MSTSQPVVHYNHPLTDGNPPQWACAWGDDDFGPWAQFRIRDARQRMRWIPPGTFLMGSPEEEEGRYENEGLRHEVTISEGFWLFDTPCTQELWEAVFPEENPSRFKSTGRPVENVSWEDAQRFTRRMNELVPGLHLTLPTEAQWEYACRADSRTATYAGDLEVVGEDNAPVLDEIAWYGGNCGVDFDLPDGEYADWPEKRCEFASGGTRPVGVKKPNRWGLYDMLGNVWEWCNDGNREYGAEQVCDPVGTRGANRGIRGGCWSDSAWDVRAAFRDWLVPSVRVDSLGFRCSSSGREPG